jgi:methylenetetrahydrofolate dehydrogenase (NADP+)/methenyltetrahydrofolate cyclohydrolase
MVIIDGKKISSDILIAIKKEIAFLPFVPIFCDILVGEDPASVQYVQMKKNIAESVGLKFKQANFPKSISTEDLIKEIEILNKIENICGIIVQLPLPPHINKKKVLDAINSELDVDCLGEIRSEKFYQDFNVGKDLAFPTALACMVVLDSINIDLTSRNIVVLGNGMLVGRPVHKLLQSRGFSPIVLSSETKESEKILKEADVIISGIGKGRYLKGDMVKDGVVLIDAGSSEENSSIVGDVDFDSVKGKASYLSPVPGGVGPVTVVMLLKNVLTVAKKKYTSPQSS